MAVSEYGLGAAGPPFDPNENPLNVGERWCTWMRNFEYYLDGQIGLSPKQKASRLLHQAGIEVQEIYETLKEISDPELVGKDEYQVVVKRLKTYFSPTANSVYERLEFRAMSMEKNETIAQFALRLKKKCKFCNFPKDDEAIRDQIIEKCVNSELKKKLLRKGNDLTLTETLEISRIYEREQDFGTEIKKEESSINRVTQDKSKKKCYRCGITGHFANDQECPAIHKVCSNCYMKGHVTKQCRTKLSKKEIKSKEFQRKKKKRIVRYVIEEDSSGSESEADDDGGHSSSDGETVKVNSVFLINQDNSNKCDILIGKKGVPFTTKESQAVKGMPLTLGLWLRRREVATEDSEAIKRLKDAGAIVVASTNLPELLVWQETRNPVYGRTNNPHHRGRTAGGSSGAEAALTASCASVISLCSDLGGSTRMPAFYCGMFGYHPTPGTTNTKGVMFRNGEEKDSMLSLGFISKHVEDLAPLTKIIAGDQAPLLKLDREIDFKEIKFYYLETAQDLTVSSIRASLRATMKSVITKISQEISTTENAPKPYYHEGFSHMYSIWRYWMTKEPERLASLCTNRNGDANGLVELFKKMFCLSKLCFFTIVRLIEEQYFPKVDAEWAEKISKEFKEDLFTKLGDKGVLLMPSAPQPAPYHFSCLLRPYNFSYWAIVNALKCPATQVPISVDAQGLPLGLQVVAAPYNDALSLAVAKYLSKEFGGSIVACKYKNV